MMDSKFPLGHIAITCPAMEILHPEDVHAALDRHRVGDWGDVCEEDWTENEQSLSQNFRLLSEYRDRNQRRFWIITEADRSATTVLLPEDY